MTQTRPAVDAELRALIDRDRLRDLVHRLGRWLDEQRWDEAAEIFTEAATAETAGGVARGRAALVEQARRNHAGARTQHVITNAVIELAGDRAAIGANLIVTFASREELSAPRFQLGERYRFEAVRTAAGWRLAGVQVHSLWRSVAADR